MKTTSESERVASTSLADHRLCSCQALSASRHKPLGRLRDLSRRALLPRLQRTPRHWLCRSTADGCMDSGFESVVARRFALCNPVLTCTGRGGDRSRDRSDRARNGRKISRRLQCQSCRSKRISSIRKLNGLRSGSLWRICSDDCEDNGWEEDR